MRHPLPAPALLLALFLPACVDRTEPPPAPPEIYRVNGLVRQLPDPERPNSELFIRHEDIPDFKDEHGHVVGMDAMTMPFPVADPALLEGLEVGDQVSFDLEVAWDGAPPIRITRIEKLPPETEPGQTAEAESEEETGGD